MNHRTPDYILTVDGRNITPRVDSRLERLSLIECRGGDADQLDLTLSDCDGDLAIPTKDAVITLHLGWRGEPLVDKGTYVVDEAEHSGAPDKVTIRARSSEMVKDLRIRRELSHHHESIDQIVSAMAGRHGLTPRVDPVLGAIVIDHIDQTHESDLNFITRLAKRFDAVATVKKGHLLFLPINGTPLPVLILTRRSGDSHRYHSADRHAYSGVRAYWHDAGRANRRSALVGQSGNAKRLRETFANEQDALAEAKAEWQRLQRGKATFSLALAQGEPTLLPQSPVRVQGFKPQIDETEWLAVKVSHSIADAGFTTNVELETAGVEGEERAEDGDGA